MIKKKFINFIVAEDVFTDDQDDLKLRFNVINIIIIIAIIGLVVGGINNFFNGDYPSVYANIVFTIIVVTTAYLIRRFIHYFELLTNILTFEILVIFNILLLLSGPESLKSLWLMTFPALIFFYRGTRSSLIWIGIFIISLFITKLQPFYPTAYTYTNLFYITFVLLAMTGVIYIYKFRIDSSHKTNLEQKEQLKLLMHTLESKVTEKTQALNELNYNLEIKVLEKAQELREKDALILAQSRQAAMGEMISMIAHQWRQPLSTITLQISNLKINAMLGKQSLDETNDALEHISSTIIYLSETIDDFQDFFKPDKRQEKQKVCTLIQNGINFVMPRITVANIDLKYLCNTKIEILTYPNEFSQVIINIINNAIDVLLERNIKNPQVHVKSEVIDQNLRVTVQDNAGGIESEILPRIFEPYFSTKGKNGTGLGLYMSKMIIDDQLNGKLEVRNVEEGAAFSISIPVEASS